MPPPQPPTATYAPTHRSPQRCPAPTAARSQHRVMPIDAPTESMSPRIDHCSPQHRSSHARIDHRSPQRSYYLAGRFSLIIWPIFFKAHAGRSCPAAQPIFFAPVAVACCQPDLGAWRRRGRACAMRLCGVQRSAPPAPARLAFFLGLRGSNSAPSKHPGHQVHHQILYIPAKDVIGLQQGCAFQCNHC
jgi:hypothetical protein